MEQTYDWLILRSSLWCHNLHSNTPVQWNNLRYSAHAKLTGKTMKLHAWIKHRKMDWKDSSVASEFTGTMNCNIIEDIFSKPVRSVLTGHSIFRFCDGDRLIGHLLVSSVVPRPMPVLFIWRKIGPGTRGTSPSRANLGEPPFPKISSTVYVRNCKFERRVTRSVNLGGEPILLRANSSR